MQTEKNGFVFYFDNLPILMSLPTDQWGWVIAALCRYAQEVWQNPDFPIEQAMGEFPALSGEGMTACRFMGAAVLRDTKRWLHQRDYRMQRRQNQREASAPARKQVPGLSPAGIPGDPGGVPKAPGVDGPGGKEGVGYKAGRAKTPALCFRVY